MKKKEKKMDQSEPKVSIIIPVYNAEEHLRQCLDSVVNQTLKEIEIICVDDGSTDNSSEILREYEVKDKRVHVLTQTNQYAGVARNHGMEQARGEYYAFLDSDDYFELNAMELLYSKCQKFSLDVIKASFFNIDPNGAISETKYSSNTRKSNNLYNRILSWPEHFEELIWIADVPWNGMYRASFIKEHHIQFNPFRVINDHSFFMWCISHSQRVMVIKDHIAYYRVNQSTSLIGSKWKYYQCQINSYNLVREIVHDLPKKQRRCVMQYEILGVFGWYKGLRSLAQPPYDEQMDKALIAFIEAFDEDDVGTYYLFHMPYTYDYFHCKSEFLKTIQRSTSGATKPFGIPKISVIIPVYNAESYIRECLESVLSQSLSPIEVICVDDGSTDNSLEILTSLESSDQRVHVYSQTNQGAAAARNYGIQVAQGEFVAFMDSDDYYPEKTTLQKLYSKAKECSVLVCGGSLCTVKDGVINRDFSNTRNWGYTFPLNCLMAYRDYQFDYGYSRFIYSRELLINNSIKFPAIKNFEDPPFFVKAMSIAKVFYAMKDVTYCYRESNHFQSFLKDKQRIQNYFCGLKIVLDYSKLLDLYDLYRLTIERFCVGGRSVLEVIKTSQNQGITTTLNDLENSIDFIYLGSDRQVEIPNEEKPDYIYGLYYSEKTKKPFFFRKDPRNRHYVRENKLYSAENRPKVSVIIPVYNVEDYLKDCLDSVINQSLHDIEIICVNDGSTDNSLAIVEDYQIKDPRISVISQANGGLSAARNCGMRYAHGEYICFLDSDDYLDLEALDKTARLGYENSLDVLIYEREIFYESDEIASQVHFNIKHITEDSKITTGPEYMRAAKEEGTYIMSACLALWRFEFLKKEQISFKEGIIHEDNLFTFLSYISAKKIMRIADKFYKRRVRSDSIMTTTTSYKNVIGYFTCAEGILNYMLLYADNPEKEEISRCFFFEMLNITKNVYASLPEKERSKIVFKREGEGVLFQQLVVSDEECKRLRRELEISNEECKRLKWDLDCVHNSVSFRAGRAFTWLPRKFRGGVRCYKEHGFRYTFDRGLIHLRLKEDPEHPKNRDYTYYSTLSTRKYPKELTLWYKRETGYDLDLRNPRSFNEKIQWMKLYDSTPLKTRLADKYLVRDWVKEKIGEEYLVPLLGVWDSFDEIDFDKLPDQFALKANHGSGWNIIVKDKSQFDVEEARKKFNQWMHTNFAFIYGFELHYLNIPPKIIAEEYIENVEGLKDYRFYCFNGKPEQVWVDIYSGTRNHLRTVYDMEWNLLPLKCTWPDGGELLREKPKTFEKMKEFASLLCQDFAFVRVDFFDVDGKLYMGEMTFTPMSGTGKFEPVQWDRELGDALSLPPMSPIPKRRL